MMSPDLELKRQIQAQIDLMIAVATGGPRIESKNEEYKERRDSIRGKLQSLGKRDPNPFDDLWAWYGRWSSGDLPTYQSRREYVRALYRDLTEELAGARVAGPLDPSREPTGWDRVDRTVDSIVDGLAKATDEAGYQTIGLLCRECLISLAQAVFDPAKHRPTNGTQASETDAYRMLDAYFAAEFPGSENEEVVKKSSSPGFPSPPRRGGQGLAGGASPRWMVSYEKSPGGATGNSQPG